MKSAPSAAWCRIKVLAGGNSGMAVVEVQGKQYTPEESLRDDPAEAEEPTRKPTWARSIDSTR